MNWRQDLMHTNLPPYGDFRKVFITHSFCKWPLYTLQPAKRKYTGAISKKHENMWISKTQCWALFVISKATFTKTAIKPKFVDRFSLKNLSAAIDQCTVKYPNFVSIENFLQKLSNVGAKLCKYWNDVIDLAKVLLWDFLLSRVSPSEIFPKYVNAVEWEKEWENRRATKRGKFSRAAWVFDELC